MTTDRPTDSLIDLLYGELSEEDEKLVREELAESAELRAELEGFEELLSEVRGALPVEEVPSSVHASIMEAARAAVENPEERAVRRTATPEPEKQGIWRRLSGGQGSQIALVAAVLIAGVFVVKFINPNTGGAPMSDISQVQEAAAPVVAKEQVEEEAAPAEVAPSGMEQAEGSAELVKAEESEAPDIWGEAQAPAEDGDSAASELLDELRSNRAAAVDESDKREAMQELPKIDEPKPAPQRRTRAPKKQKSKDAPLMLDNKSGKRAAELEKTLDSDIFGGEAYGSKSGPADRADTVTTTKSADFDRAEEEAAAEPAPAPSSAQPEPEAKADEYRAEANSLAAVTQRWRANDYNGTIRAADDFLATDGGSRTERARALQLKAQSLARLGQYSQADRVYRSIQNNYPGYQANEINRARDEIQQKLRKRPARKKKAAPRPASEQDDMMLDSLD